ncbi:aminoglycoside phosphotransferase family protein, partial [Frankia sp. CcWB2]
MSAAEVLTAETALTPPAPPSFLGGPTPTLHTVETTTALLFFVGERVYKMPKPVMAGSVDLRRRQAREEACQTEVALNRRLAPDVYLAVADVRDEADLLRDHMVVMRRLPVARRLTTLVERGGWVDQQLRDLARRLAAFHESCETSARIGAAGSLAAMQARWLDLLRAVAPFRGEVLAADVVDEIERLALRYLAGRAPLLAERRRAGRIRDGHGDLIADHVFCLSDGVRVIDCLASDRQGRIGDVLADAACLAMDLERLGAPDEARRFLAWYREFSAETHPVSLDHHYI